LLVLALTTTSALADDFMLGPGRVMSAPRASADCDTGNPAEEPAASSGATARVIYHDGQNAPVSVPVNPRGGVGAGATVSTVSNTPDAAPTTPRMPSAEPAVPQKPRNGLRWQSVLPGSIK
jgi:hypothetical protein